MESWWNDPCSRKLLSPKRAMGCPFEAARRIRAMGVAECCGLEVRAPWRFGTARTLGHSRTNRGR